MKSIGNKIDYGYGSLEEAFPACPPGVEPLGSRVLCQIRTPKKKTAGGIIIIDEVRETDHYNTQVAKVIACGPVAFHNRSTLERWPEGHWAAPGEFVRVPKYGGDRWSMKVPGDEDTEVIFAIFNDLDLIGKVSGDPLAMKAFL